MAGYPVIDPAGVDITDVNGAETHYALGDVVPLAKLMSRRYGWLVERGYLSEDFSETFDTSVVTGDLTVTGFIYSSSTTDSSSTITGALRTLGGLGVAKNIYVGTGLNLAGISDTATAATHYFVETATDGFVRPKTLANVKTEIVTTAAVNSAAATTVGTISSGTWQGSVISATYIDSAIARLASPTFTGTVTTPILSVINPSKLVTAVDIQRTVASDSPSDANIARISYNGTDATWVNEKGNLRTSNVGSPAEDALKVIGSSSISGNYIQVVTQAGTSVFRIGSLGKVNATAGMDVTGGATLDTLIGSGTTDSSSSTTGAFKTAGGMGIAKKLYVGTDLTVSGTTALNDNVTVAGAKKISFTNSGSVANYLYHGGNDYALLGLITIGRSATGYGTIGDGYQTTSTANTYKYDRNDYATQIDFASGGIKLKTAASGTEGDTVTFTDRLSITNGGITTLPTQPSFSAYRYDAAGTITFTASTDIPFNTTNHNVGSHFSTSTGRFTAPVAGKYLFSAHFFKYTTYDNNTNTYWGFFVNGARTTTINHGVEGQDGGQSHSAIISLNANDYVSVQHNDSLSTYSGVYNNFSGHLLG